MGLAGKILPPYPPFPAHTHTQALAAKAQTLPLPNPLIKRAPPHYLTPESLLALALSSVWSPPAEELHCLPVDLLSR